MSESAPSNDPDAGTIRSAVDKAHSDIVAALDRLSADLPVGYAVDAVTVNVSDAYRMDGTKERRFIVRMSLGV